MFLMMLLPSNPMRQILFYSYLHLTDREWVYSGQMTCPRSYDLGKVIDLPKNTQPDLASEEDHWLFGLEIGSLMSIWLSSLSVY